MPEIPTKAPEAPSTERCDECEAEIPVVNGGRLENHHHRESCSLHVPPPMDFKTDREVQGQLVEITQQQYDYMLNVMPPLYARGCFAMGEPVDHTREGVTYHWAAKRSDKFFICYGTKAQAEPAFSR